MAEDLTPPEDPTEIPPEEYAKLLGGEDFDPLTVPQDAGADIPALQMAAARKRMADMAKLPPEITGGSTAPLAPTPDFDSTPAYRPPGDTFMGEVENIHPANEPTGTEAAIARQTPPPSAMKAFVDGVTDHITAVPIPAPPLDTHRPGGTEFVLQPDPARVHVPDEPDDPEKWNAIEASRAPLPERDVTQADIVAYLVMRVQDMEQTKKTNQSLGATAMSTLHRNLEFLRDTILPAVRELRG